MRVYQPGEQYCFASVKRDGWSLTMDIKGCSVRLLTRTADITESLSWTEWYKNAVKWAPYRADETAKLFGELWLPGGTASDVQAAIIRRDPKLRFDVWGVDYYGETLYQEIGTVARLWFQSVVKWNVITTPIDPAEYLADCNVPDVEGWVFANGNMKDYCKLKPITTADLVVFGAVEGTGRNAGAIGALIVGTADGTILAKVSAGLTDAIRRGGEIPTGQVVEVAFNGLASRGRLRFPRFVRFREDKTRLEADTLESIQQMAKGGDE